MASDKRRLSSRAEIKEIKDLHNAMKIGIDYICKKFKELNNENCETDPNDVVKWLEKSHIMAQNIIAFHELINNIEEEDDTVRGGAKINKFEIPR